MCGCACGCKNCGAGACAAHYQNVCDVRAGENPRTLTVLQNVSKKIWSVDILVAQFC